MQLRDQRVLLTGASSGIGRELALQLATQGAKVALIGRQIGPLERVRDAIVLSGGTALAMAADITQSEGRAAAVGDTNRVFGGIDILINNAGTQDFNEFAQADPAVIEDLLRTNLLAPLLLTHAVLPQLLSRNSGLILNVGSIFGSIGFGYFAAYSSSKFGLRGFSEALRRELAGTGVGVTYVAPRTTRTPINSSAVYRMAEAVKMNLDTPETVAALIVTAMVRDRKECYLGWPESLFVRINGLLPRLVDRAVRKQISVMRGFAVKA